MLSNNACSGMRDRGRFAILGCGGRSSLASREVGFFLHLLEQALGDLGVRAMSFIDWSDAEGIFGLLVELVADETTDCQNDPERRRFLADLLAQLRALGARLPRIPVSVAIHRLRDLHESADPEFADDTVIVHLRDCIEEFERVENGG